MTVNVVRKRDIPFIMAGLMVGMLMASLDNTIVGTALPTIAIELDGVQHFTWPVTAYMLSSTISLLIFGKMADIYGRKKIFMIGISIFIISSVLCGMSQTMDQLIIFRGLQGVGGGMVTSLAFIIVGDLFSSRERGKYMGILASMFALASVIGPYLGGFITDSLDWRWVFYVNIPFGILSAVLIYVRLPNIRSEHVKPHIDYLGIAAATLGVVPLLLAISWGGTEGFEWDSFEIISMVSVSLVSLGFFVWFEIRAVEPVMPLCLFKIRMFNIATLGAATASFVMMAAIMAITLFAQGVMGLSATTSGQVLTPAVLCLAVTSIMTGRAISKSGKYRLFGIIGFIVSIFGCWLLATINTSTSLEELYIFSAVFGIGVGFTMPVFSIAIQNAFEPHERATATASNQFLRNVGGTLGLAALNNIIAAALVGGFHPSTLATSIQVAFWVCIAISALGLLAAILLKEVPLKSHDAMVTMSSDS